MKGVEICREWSLRNYPSALNRASRIAGYQDADEGLRLLQEGIDQGRAMSDGWFWLANLVEYAELAYRTLAATERPEYREAIIRHEPDLPAAMSKYQFPDLRGRWEIVRAHLALWDWKATDESSLLEVALRDYINGFQHIAERGHVGSSGTYVIPAAETFGELLRSLPADIQSQWLNLLRVSWRGSRPGSMMLQAELEKLY